MFVRACRPSNIAAVARRAKSLGEPFQSRGKFGIASWNAMAAPDNVGMELGEFFYRQAGCIPVGVERCTGARQRLASGHEAAPRIHVHRRESVARDQNTIGWTKKRNVSGRMSRRGQPFPASCARHFVRLQFANPSCQIARAGRREAGKECHRPSDRRIGRGIIGFAGEIRHLETMGVNRDVPIFCQRPSRTGMIEMAVGQDDRFRRRARSEPRFRCFDDLMRPARQTGINEHPGAAGSSDKININETDRQPADVGCYAGYRGHGERDSLTDTIRNLTPEKTWGGISFPLKELLAWFRVSISPGHRWRCG